MALLAGGAAVVQQRGDGPDAPDPVVTSSPAALPDRGVFLAARTEAAMPTPAGLRAVVATALADPALGGQLAAAVVDVETGEVLLDRRGDASVIPASTAKIATAVAALSELDAEARLSTRVVAGATPGQVVLVGGGDPTLNGTREVPAVPVVATVADLAAQVTASGVRVTSVVVDDSLYTGPLLGPAWRPSYVTDGDVAPVTALQVDGGRSSEQGPRSQQPSLAAGRALAVALGVPDAPVTEGVAAPGAAPLGEVRSPTIAQLTEIMLTRSDNDLAEALARQVALATGQPASFEGAALAVDRALAAVVPGSPPEQIALVDASGLSRSDRLEPLGLARLLATVAGPDETGRWSPVLSGLPVAGFDGTLGRRFREGPSTTAAGVVRGKTGTLNGVSALAGLVRTRDGRLLAFDLTADAVPLGANRGAEDALDALAAALASCGCR